MIVQFFDEFGRKIIPKYIEISLAHFPKSTRVESLVQSMTLIVDALPARDPKFINIALFCVQQYANRVKEIHGKTVSTKLFAISLIYLLAVCNEQILLDIVHIIENLIVSVSFERQKDFCLLVKNVITRNFDPFRKSLLVNWYLHLINCLQLNDETVAVPARAFASLRLSLPAV